MHESRSVLVLEAEGVIYWFRSGEKSATSHDVLNEAEVANTLGDPRRLNPEARCQSIHLNRGYCINLDVVLP